MLNAVMLNAVMLNAVMLNAVMLSVVMLSVVAPVNHIKKFARQNTKGRKKHQDVVQVPRHSV